MVNKNHCVGVWAHTQQGVAAPTLTLRGEGRSGPSSELRCGSVAWADLPEEEDFSFIKKMGS